MLVAMCVCSVSVGRRAARKALGGKCIRASRTPGGCKLTRCMQTAHARSDSVMDAAHMKCQWRSGYLCCAVLQFMDIT
jgi:hypothetical protein